MTTIRLYVFNHILSLTIWSCTQHQNVIMRQNTGVYIGLDLKSFSYTYHMFWRISSLSYLASLKSMISSKLFCNKKFFFICIKTTLVLFIIYLISIGFPVNSMVLTKSSIWMYRSCERKVKSIWFILKKCFEEVKHKMLRIH